MHYFLKIYFLLVCLITLQACNYSTKNEPSQDLLSSTALLEDFNVLQKTLEEAHPGIYWYTDKIAIDHIFDSTTKLLNHSMSNIEFYKILLPVITNVRCSHTSIRLPQKVNSVSPLINLLPFEFFCHDGKVIISKNLNGKRYEGKEIVTINGIETKQILKTLLNSIPADGYNETIKYNLLTRGAFREGFALYYSQPNWFSFQCADRQNKLDSFSAAAIPPSKQNSSDAVSTPFVLNFNQNIAILTANTFQLNRQQFSDSVIKIFASINKNGGNKLIIDLRNNGGGINDNVSTLYAYIALAPFLHLKRAEMNVSSVTYPNFVTNPKSIEDFSNTAVTKGVKEVNDKYSGTTTKLPANSNVFKGDIVLLTSGLTSSAASEFVAITHYLKRAKIVGEETGGCYYGGTGGNYIQLKLPNSGFELRIPTIRIFNAVREDFTHQPKGRGTLPDYQVLPTLKDITTGNDVQLKTALTILKE